MDLASGTKPLGRLVVELYHDLSPVGATHLRNRCLSGSKASLQGSTAHKLQAGYAVWLGKSAAAADCFRVPLCSRLRHVELGAVSLSLN
ncbi:uncharacterized protein HaLaN_32211, partial [Haematococcus lacustris]